jgi:hypothetical protein
MNSHGWTSVEERFWAKVDKSAGPEACWPWTAARAQDNYGHFSLRGKIRTAQSVALELTQGARPQGYEGMHSCDNPPCCNPAHLSWGTKLQNQQQKAERGRSYRAQGEAHHMVKLTNAQVRELRARYIPRHPVHGASAIARELGMSQYAISQAVTGRGWKHL